MDIWILGALTFIILLFFFNRATRNEYGLYMSYTAFPAENVMTGGQPRLADLPVLKEKGVTTVINLRGLGENLGFDETAELQKLGIKYVQIPMCNAADLTLDNVKKLDKALKKVKGTALVHCASSNRVGALLAVREFHINGKTAEEAMAFGTSAGMKGLTPAVQAVLVK